MGSIYLYILMGFDIIKCITLVMMYSKYFHHIWGQSMWDLWWTKCHYNSCFSPSTRVSPSVSFCQRCLHIPLHLPSTVRGLEL